MRVIKNGEQLLAVYELDPKETGARKVLVFEAPESSICVDEYPGDWHRMSEESLLALRGALR